MSTRPSVIMIAKKSFSDSEARKKCGELSTVPYNLFVKPSDQPLNPTLLDVMSDKSKRMDGRTWKEHRKIHMKCGVVEDARGSAYVEIGGTKVIAAATGPVEMPQNLESEEKGFLNCEVKFSQFTCKSRDEEEELGTEIETVTDGINRALEPAVIKEELGNVQLNLVVTVIESDGNMTSACVIAASLAVANGRIPMNDLVASATIAVLPSNCILLDPTLSEEEFALAKNNSSNSHGLLNLSYMGSSDQVTDLVISGKLEVGSIIPSLPFLKTECSKIYAKMQLLLKEDVRQNVDIIVAKNSQEQEHETTNAVREELAKLST